ncbi:MAG: hypothetical protein ACOH1Y_04140 [Propionicimonas sp.]
MASRPGAETDAGRASEPAARLFVDSGCGFCVWSTWTLLPLLHGSSVQVEAIDSAAGKVALGTLTPEQRWSSWHLLRGDGQLFSAGAVVGQLLRMIPGARPLARLADATPRATGAMYRAVARRRGLWIRFVPGSLVARARHSLHLFPTPDRQKGSS